MNDLRKGLSNVLGWRSSRKILVFESDDWGSIRTRSRKDYTKMLSKGLEVDKSNFTAYDCLESNSDLENLYEVLFKNRDSCGKPAIFTPMCIMANPDFERIEESGFTEYHYESFADTCKRYPHHDRVVELWQKGIRERMFVPGFHGREHVNTVRWLRALRSGEKGLLVAFEHASFGANLFKGKAIPEYLGALHPESFSEIQILEEVIHTGAKLFKMNCGYKPTHFIAPNQETPKMLDQTLFNEGVRYLTMSKIRHYPLGDNRYRYELNWLGKRNRFGQTIITRNCIFEPSSDPHRDWVDSCMKEISLAFKWRKPAVINTHRVNYIGSIEPQNAMYGLKALHRLLNSIINKWPEIEFMTSSELGELIEGKNKV